MVRSGLIMKQFVGKVWPAKSLCAHPPHNPGSAPSLPAPSVLLKGKRPAASGTVAAPIS